MTLYLKSISQMRCLSHLFKIDQDQVFLAIREGFNGIGRGQSGTIRIKKLDKQRSVTIHHHIFQSKFITRIAVNFCPATDRGLVN